MPPALLVAFVVDAAGGGPLVVIEELDEDPVTEVTTVETDV